MRRTIAAAVASAMRELILQHGIPVLFISDNGPPFGSSEFHTFCEEWGITLRPISPGHSSANGMIERTIQTIKSTVEKALDSGVCMTEALLALRTTPAEDGVSPARKRAANEVTGGPKLTGERTTTGMGEAETASPRESRQLEEILRSTSA